ncbi:hypothetical protein MAA_01286 [Metarhizium robertsii ARSEF 23]|nr:uncharacterized protein MAA_01286 [Metarhizium robertsii ARSEF 23]EFZ04212.2 hypothetical protein MAA_01286 [Metarhizium robertsii ARSEF 23]
MMIGRVLNVVTGNYGNYLGRAVFCHIRSTKRVPPRRWKPELDRWVGDKWAEVMICGSELLGEDVQRIPFFVYQLFIIFPSSVQWVKLHSKLVEILLGNELELSFSFAEVEIWDSYPDKSAPTHLSTFYGSCFEKIKNDGCIFGDAEAVSAECSRIEHGSKTLGFHGYTDYILFDDNDNDSDTGNKYTSTNSYLSDVAIFGDNDPSTWLHNDAPSNLFGQGAFYRASSMSPRNRIKGYSCNTDNVSRMATMEEQDSAYSSNSHPPPAHFDTKHDDMADEYIQPLRNENRVFVQMPLIKRMDIADGEHLEMRDDSTHCGCGHMACESNHQPHS